MFKNIPPIFLLIAVLLFINGCRPKVKEGTATLLDVSNAPKEQLLNELNETSNYFFGVFDNNNPAGYTKLRTSENPEELAGKKHIELERIYALKKYQGMGLGYKMIGHCIEFASENNYEVLWLGVWKQNEKAFQFYKRCGFEIFGEHIFTLGSDEQIDWLMQKELSHAK